LWVLSLNWVVRIYWTTSQCWIHHEGKDASRGGYGDKTAEFLMDGNIHFFQSEIGRFEMFFSTEKGGKARHRCPDNEHFYRDLALTFVEGQWRQNGAPIARNGSRKATDEVAVMKAVHEACMTNHIVTGNHRASRESVRNYLSAHGYYELVDGKWSEADRKAVNRTINKLITKDSLFGDRTHLWPAKRNGDNPDA